jgi:peroxin-6
MLTLSYYSLPASSSTPSAIVYFLITSLSVDTPSSPLSPLDSTELDHALEDGLLGCVVDPKVTKLLQTGIERGRVPDAGPWLGLRASLPLFISSPRPHPYLFTASLPLSLAPTLLGDPTPSSRLHEFITSTLEPQARTYGLPATVLLKGAKGSGKRTVVRGVAGKAGMGVLEVRFLSFFHALFFSPRSKLTQRSSLSRPTQLDCFDLLGETDLKTEGRIRALAVDKALACSPCVLMLRNIEALARKDRAMETGQGAILPSLFFLTQ